MIRKNISDYETLKNVESELLKKGYSGPFVYLTGLPIEFINDNKKSLFYNILLDEDNRNILLTTINMDYFAQLCRGGYSILKLFNVIDKIIDLSQHRRWDKWGCNYSEITLATIKKIYEQREKYILTPFIGNTRFLVLVPEMDYESLEIGDGAEAFLKYKDMLSLDQDDVRRKEIKKNLLKYCKQDTLAMVRLLNYLEACC